MATLNLTFRRALLALFVVVQSAFFSVIKASPIERDFDTIREFQSYDPATNKWSKIEDFDTVDILDDPTEYREDHYIYHGFWAYDAVTNRWHKVDIRDYGYKRKPLASAKSIRKVAVTTKKRPGSPIRFWKNMTLGLRAGGGRTFYETKISGLSIREKDSVYYLQTPQQKRRKAGVAARWHGERYAYHSDFKAETLRKIERSQESIFKGEGWNIPVTSFMHYTFFNWVRLGGGGTVEINYLDKLTYKKNTDSKAFEMPLAHKWFFNASWFGLIGLKILNTPHQNIFLDLQAGKNYNLGADLKQWTVAKVRSKKFIYNGLLVGVGATYESKINNYFKWVVRLGADWKTHDDIPDRDGNGNKDKKVFVKHNQLAAHLDLGLQLNFGKDVTEEEYETDSDQ